MRTGSRTSQYKKLGKTNTNTMHFISIPRSFDKTDGVAVLRCFRRVFEVLKNICEGGVFFIFNASFERKRGTKKDEKKGNH